MNEWLDKPDGDGLWWFQVIGRKGIHLYAVCDNRARYVLHVDGRTDMHGDSLSHIESMVKGKWQRCIATPPAPYVPPQPPKVEQYTAMFKDGECHKPRFLTRIGDVFVATDAKGRGVNFELWDRRHEDYTDIQPCDQASTK